MRKPFNLKEYLLDKTQKVETRKGEPVEIVLTDWGFPFPVLGRIGRGGDPVIWTSDGKPTLSESSDDEYDNDLFFVCECTEFENKLAEIIKGVVGDSSYPDEKLTPQEVAHIYADKLIELAQKEFPINVKRMLEIEYKRGKKDVLDELITSASIDTDILTKLNSNGWVVIEKWKLPKFEEAPNTYDGKPNLLYDVDFNTYYLEYEGYRVPVSQIFNLPKRMK